MKNKTKKKSDNKPKNKVTIEQINELVQKVKAALEEAIGKKLFAEKSGKDPQKPFWRISERKNSKEIICTIYFPEKGKLGFWCTKENCAFKVYVALIENLGKLANEKGLTIKELNPPRENK